MWPEVQRGNGLGDGNGLGSGYGSGSGNGFGGTQEDDSDDR